MPSQLTLRQFQIAALSLWLDRSQKEIAAAAGYSSGRVSQFLSRDTDINDEAYERLLAALPSPPGTLAILAGCHDALTALSDDESGLTPEERAEIEMGVLAIAASTREALTEAVLLSRQPPPDGFPSGAQAGLDRERAEVLWNKLKNLSDETRLAVAQVAEEFQGWALCERVCAESEIEASRNLERSAHLARLAQEIADRVPGPEGWRQRLQGYAQAHAANVVRVSGDLKGSDTAFEAAKELWNRGADPVALLDPGRLPDLEASLRRAQRRFSEALALLDEAFATGRSQARALVKKGFTLEAMGEYGRSIETLLQAERLGGNQSDPRLPYMRFNLAVNYCHTGRIREAAELLDQIRELATALGDEVFLVRVAWLQGRIAAGQGRFGEARSLLAQARREFAARGMSYDAALALLEEAALLLGKGQTVEVKTLAMELAVIFNSKGVHREALAAVRVFHQAAEKEEATAELARRILCFLYRARYDQGLQFEL